MLGTRIEDADRKELRVDEGSGLVYSNGSFEGVSRIEGAEIGESLVCEGGTELVSFSGILYGNEDDKLKILALVQSLVSEGGSDIE